MPSRRLTNLKSPPVVSVALVNTTQGDAFVEALAQERANVDGARANRRASSASLSPTHLARCFEGAEGISELVGAPCDLQDILLVWPKVSARRCELREDVVQGKEGVLGNGLGWQRRAATVGVARQRAEEVRRPLQDRIEQPRGVPLAAALAAESRPGVAREAFEHGRREARTEEERRRVLDLVGFVENDGVVVRQHRGKAGVAKRQVSKEQVVVDDHELGALRTPAYAGRETLVIVTHSGRQFACPNRSPRAAQIGSSSAIDARAARSPESVVSTQARSAGKERANRG